MGERISLAKKIRKKATKLSMQYLASENGMATIDGTLKTKRKIDRTASRLYHLVGLASLEDKEEVDGAIKRQTRRLRDVANLVGQVESSLVKLESAIEQAEQAPAPAAKTEKKKPVTTKQKSKPVRKKPVTTKQKSKPARKKPTTPKRKSKPPKAQPIVLAKPKAKKPAAAKPKKKTAAKKKASPRQPKPLQAFKPRAGQSKNLLDLDWKKKAKKK